MKRLLISISEYNLSTYVDLFINHGKVFNFPWLIAHHFHFFGDFKNLTILDTLLKHRRGFNVPIGSKIRKLYFSDVNRILSDSRELQIACCEKFPETKAFNSTKEFVECSTVIHNVRGTEGCETIIDSIDDDLDIHDFPKSKVRIDEIKEKVIETKRVTPGFKDFFNKLLVYSEKSLNEVLTEEQILRVKKIKENRAVETQKLAEMNSEIYEKIRKIPARVETLFEGGMVNKSTLDNRTRGYIMIINKLIIYIKEYDNVMEPIKKMARLYANRKKSFFTDPQIIESWKFRVAQHVKRKKEAGFMNIDEIYHACKSLHLDERVKLLDELHENSNKLKKDYEEKKTASIRRELREAILSARGLEEELEPMVEAYSLIDKNIYDVEYIGRPIYLKPLINKFLDIGGVNEDMALLTRAGELHLPSVLDSLERLKAKITRDVKGIDESEVEGLGEFISKIYEDAKSHILLKINNNENPDIEYLENKYDMVKKKRNELTNNNKGLWYKLDDLKLNKWERENLEQSIEFLKNRETSYIIKKDLLENETVNILYNNHNKNLMYVREKISPALEEGDWIREVYKKLKGEYEEVVSEYEKHLKIYTDITGFSPFGHIIGSKTLKESKGSNSASTSGGIHVDLDLFGFKKQVGYINEIIDVTNKEVSGDLDYDSMGCDYLKELVRGKRLDYNLRSKEIKENLTDKIRMNNEKIKSLESKGGEETLYDIIDGGGKGDFKGSEEKVLKKHSNPNFKAMSGKKIESDFNLKKLKRSVADQKFIDIVSKTAFLSKNMYEELEVEEAIVDSNHLVEGFFRSEVSPYYCFDYKKYKSYRFKKISVINNAKANGCEGIDLLRAYNEFDLNNNSNSNKNYSVQGMISYIKILVAFKLLRMNVNKEIYRYFGLKKCQSNYLKDSLVRIAIRMTDTKIRGKSSIFGS